MDRLEELYIKLGESTGPVDEKLLTEIWELEHPIHLLDPEPEPEPLYCNPNCNGMDCWDCAAIRGGCPEDV